MSGKLKPCHGPNSCACLQLRDATLLRRMPLAVDTKAVSEA